VDERETASPHQVLVERVDIEESAASDAKRDLGEIVAYRGIRFPRFRAVLLEAATGALPLRRIPDVFTVGSDLRALEMGEEARVVQHEIVEDEDAGVLEERGIEEIVMGAVAHLVHEHVRLRRQAEALGLFARR
jgi:hypothetical protein